jgi:hypothetical protein
MHTFGKASGTAHILNMFMGLGSQASAYAIAAVRILNA